MLKSNEHMVIACDTSRVPRDMYPSIVAYVERLFLDCGHESMGKARTIGIAWAVEATGGAVYTGLAFVVENPSSVTFRGAESAAH